MQKVQICTSFHLKFYSEFGLLCVWEYFLSSYRLLLKHGTERNETERNENGTLRSINGTGENQTYGTEMIIMERNILLQNVAPEREIVGLTLLSIIILNERS